MKRDQKVQLLGKFVDEYLQKKALIPYYLVERPLQEDDEDYDSLNHTTETCYERLDPTCVNNLRTWCHEKGDTAMVVDMADYRASSSYKPEEWCENDDEIICIEVHERYLFRFDAVAYVDDKLIKEWCKCELKLQQVRDIMVDAMSRSVFRNHCQTSLLQIMERFPELGEELKWQLENEVHSMHGTYYPLIGAICTEIDTMIDEVFADPNFPYTMY